jgi:signal transduction histidine kinase/phage shock protein PspC (stress-responsive transcriptional regulator)
MSPMALSVGRRDHRSIHDPSHHRRRPSGERAAASAGFPWIHATHHATHPSDPGPVRRRHDGRLLGGVAVALAARTGFDVTVVRIALVLAGLASGVGVAAYVVAWLLVPAEDEPDSIGARSLADGRGLALALSLAPALVIALLLASTLRSGWLGSLAWPLVVAAAGMVLIWRNGSEVERVLLRRVIAPVARIGTGPATRPWSGLVGRLVVGAALAVGGVAVLSIGHRNALARPLGGIVLVLAAAVVVFGPWWLTVARDLVVERQARLRAEERADIAARVHDSVLQTLAMIQRNAADAPRVAQLARAQERELRSWLWEGRPPGSFGDELGTVAAAVGRIQADVEAVHGAHVEVVVVGDAPITDAIEGLLGAGREATVNAAKWSGADVVSLFAEVEEGKVSLFVRDRGRGFEPGDVGPDRRGISESIEARMARVGGTAVVRSTPGVGTEVRLTVPRRARDRGSRAAP